jgi:hypothetical protein
MNRSGDFVREGTIRGLSVQDRELSCNPFNKRVTAVQEFTDLAGTGRSGNWRCDLIGELTNRSLPV